jgi:hypothetical protein
MWFTTSRIDETGDILESAMRPRFTLALILFGCIALGLLHAKQSSVFPDEKAWAVYDGQSVYSNPLDSGEPHEWVWTRLRYNGFGGFGGGGGGRRGGFGGYGAWAIDYNKGDRALATGLRRLTLLDARLAEQVVDLDGSKDIYNWPFLYAVEVGRWDLNEEEAKQLRGFLDRGGFLLVDDFHCDDEWENFMVSFQLVYPDREVADIPDTDPIAKAIFQLDFRRQIPGRNGGRNGRLDECGNRADPLPHYRAVYDDKQRVNAAIIHNSDLGDAIEYSDDPNYPEEYATEAFHILTNYIIYNLTH